MNTLLREIVETKKRSLPSILKAAVEVEAPRLSLKDALARPEQTNIIAEIKKASPSRGTLVEQFYPAGIAREYRDGGACALSVLTDEPYFQGDGRYIGLAKEAANLPVLCKDFFIDPKQMDWAKNIGADAVLLIVRICSGAQVEELYAAAKESGLDVLVETHSEGELEEAVEMGADIIGVNCRDLDTFETDLNVTRKLARFIPKSVVSVAESAIQSRKEIVSLQELGYHAFLVGESLMTAPDRSAKLRELTGSEV